MEVINGLLLGCVVGDGAAICVVQGLTFVSFLENQNFNEPATFTV